MVQVKPTSPKDEVVLQRTEQLSASEVALSQSRHYYCYMKHKNIELHSLCQCEIRWRMFKGKDKPTAGLFCKNHDVFLDWLRDQDATLLISNGIHEAAYVQRKKTKTSQKNQVVA